MKNISLQDFFEVINAAPAVLMSTNVIIPAVTNPELVEEDEPFLILSWSDDVGYLYRSDFYAKNNQTIKVDGCKVTLTEYDGNEMVIAILEQKNFN